MKEERWYEVKSEDEIHVYNAPFETQATSVSCVTKADLPYYRRTFKLSKAWTLTQPENGYVAP